MTTGSALKNIRKELKYTQLDMAKKLGYSIPQFISLLENNRSYVPKTVAAKVLKLAASRKSKLKFKEAINNQLIERYWGV